VCKKCVFTLFGKHKEHCVKCGAENPVVTLWRQLVVAAIETGCDVPTHPYLVSPKTLVAEQLMTLREYKRAMRSKNF